MPQKEYLRKYGTLRMLKSINVIFLELWFQVITAATWCFIPNKFEELHKKRSCFLIYLHIRLQQKKLLPGQHVLILRHTEKGPANWK